MSDRLMAKDVLNFVRVTCHDEYNYEIEYVVYYDNHPPTPAPYASSLGTTCRAHDKDSAMFVAKCIADACRVNIRYIPMISQEPRNE